MSPIPAVGAIVVHDGRLLLVQRGAPPRMGHWAPPGGRIEAGETAEEAVVRELAEETGLQGRVLRRLGTVERSDAPGERFTICDLLVAVDDLTPLRAASDAAAVAWVPLAGLAAGEGPVPLVPGLVAFLRECGVLGRPHPPGATAAP